MEQASIQNLDFLRRLIAESRDKDSYNDMDRLRMIEHYLLGTGTVPQGEAE